MLYHLHDFVRPLLIIYAECYHQRSKQKDASPATKVTNAVSKAINALYFFTHPKASRAPIKQYSTDISSSKRNFADTIAQEARQYSCYVESDQPSYLQQVYQIMSEYRERIAIMTPDTSMKDFDNTLESLKLAISVVHADFQAYKDSILASGDNKADKFANLMAAKAALYIVTPANLQGWLLSIQEQQETLLAGQPLTEKAPNFLTCT